MNLFKALSNGHGKISETNITSFLSYLLNQTSELGVTFAALLLKRLDDDLDNWISQTLNLTGLTLREFVGVLERDYFISADPEVAVIGNGSKQIVDIILTISDPKSQKDLIYILIENKVNSGAKNPPQCAKQYLTFKASEDFENTANVVSLLVTNDDKAFQSTFENVRKVNDKSAWLKWIGKEEDAAPSIYELIQDLLHKEHIGALPPISLETKGILRQFNDFLWSEFYPQSKTKRQVTINGIDQIEQVEVSINGRIEVLARYANQSIRFLDQKNEVISQPVKPKLIHLIENLGLNVDLHLSTGYPKNTRTLGKDAIAAIKATIR